jgi:ATP-dependent protease Clp ATPase subunit
MSTAVDHKCSYCGATKDDYRGLVPGPEVYICNLCVGKALQAVLSNAPQVVQGSSSPEPYCTFCGKGAGETKRLATTETAVICDECLAEAFTILMEGDKPLKGAVQFC